MLLSWFELQPILLWHNLLNLLLWHSMVFWCLASFTLLIQTWHSLKLCLSTSLNGFSIYVSLSDPYCSMVSLIVIICSFISFFSTFITILELLGVLILFINFTFTGMKPFLNLLCFSKSVIFYPGVPIFAGLKHSPCQIPLLHVNVGFSFCLIVFISRTRFSIVLMNRNI